MLTKVPSAYHSYAGPSERPDHNPIYRTCRQVNALVARTYGERIRNFTDVDYKRLYDSKDAASQERRKKRHFPYIALDPERFLLTFVQFERRFGLDSLRSASFVDVGCGIGDKLLIASKLFGIEQVTGIEYGVEVAEIARTKVPEATVIQGDAFEQDFSGYDVIYFYHPISDAQEQARLFMHMYNTAKAGAVLVEPYFIYHHELQARNTRMRAALKQADRDTGLMIEKTPDGPVAYSFRSYPSPLDDSPERLMESKLLRFIERNWTLKGTPKRRSKKENHATSILLPAL